jgi:hypothetical protein
LSSNQLKANLGSGALSATNETQNTCYQKTRKEKKTVV